MPNSGSQNKNQHKNYEILNLIGYGLAKFDLAFVKAFGYKTKSSFYSHMIKIGIAETVGTVKNRQDLFDPFFANTRKGWWQKGNAYIHRKIFIDSLFGNLDVTSYADVVKLYLKAKLKIDLGDLRITPILKSRFKQLQITGQEAELYFLNNYSSIDEFKDGKLEDARLFGDGYDFQVEVESHYFLTEVKGLRTQSGSIRFTQNEYKKAREYRDDYALIVVSNLNESPKISPIFNPVKILVFKEQTISQSPQLTYNTGSILW